MADDLIFPIGFDLEKGVEEASKDWDKYAKKLETALAKRAVKVKLSLDTTKLDNLEDVKKRLAQIKIEPITPATRDSIKELAKELQTLAKALEQVQKFSKTNQLGQQNFRNDVALERLRQANERLEIQKRRVALAEQKHAEAMRRSTTASRELSQSFSEQDGYISRLLKRMAVYAAYSGVNTFLTSVREVTAQFELQRISLGAIIQDQQRANQIFAEIKSFALTSPLKILDLTKYTKQMAAYGFATDQVFDVTKRLADISVGLGVDMGRLSLAVSQIKAATVLKSSELRQLTETGLPMLDLLAKKLTETQGKIVTAADVMDLISKRAISYEMVEEILYDLTDAGGMFYNMQIKQSQTLFGMWSKLGDAAAIMYDQIGNTQGVNEGMKTLIHSLELLMRNWKDTARVIDVAVGSMAVYALGLKNVSISTKALAGTTALLNLAHKQQVIQTPKIVAAIIGQNLATKASTNLTRLHTAAVLRQAAATNILTSTFWKLTAAMLSNPWVAAAAAITAVTLALFHFIGNTETAAERIEKLNNSVASLKNIEDTVTPLIDTYNELINKTERTAEEEKKLSEVTHELAKRYPGAITAIGDFGNEIELAADKLNELYQAEKKARMDNTRYELGKTEKKIEETEAKIQRLQQQIVDGEKWGGGQSGAMVGLTDEDKGKLIEQLDELKKELFKLKNTATEAKRSLGEIPSEAAEAVEKFGAWKKTFTTFRQQVGDVRVQLFDDSTINQFGSLDEALKKTAEEYKKNIALVATYDDTLKSTVLTAEERAKIEAERAEADAMSTLAKNALEYYNALSLIEEKSGGGRTSDPRLQTLQEIANKMAEVNKEYDELLKKEGQTKALADTQKLFASSFKQMEDVAKTYNFELPAFEVPQTVEDVQKWYKAIMDNIKRLNLKNADKVLIELGFKSDKLAIDKQQKDIEAQLKQLADRISRTKTAKEFYEKILGMTGDLNLASKVSMSIYGDTGDLKALLAKQVRELTNGVELPEGIIKADNLIDYKALRKFAEANKDEIGETYKELINIADDGQKDLAKTYEGYLKDLEKAKTYSDKRIELARTTVEKIKAIEADIAAGRMDANVGGNIIKGLQEKEVKETANLQYEAFKDSALYIQMFEDLDYASTSALERMRDRLVALKGQWKNLNPTQIKELQARLKEIDEQIARRNPFKALADAWNKWQNLRKSGRTKEGDEKMAADAEDARKAAEEKMMADERAYEATAKAAGENSIAAIAMRAIADKSKEAYDNAEKTSDEAAEQANEWKTIGELIDGANEKIDEYQSQINEALDGVRKMMVAFGAGDEDLQFFDDVVDGLNEIVDAGQDAATAVAGFMSMTPQGILTGVTKGISAIGGLVSGVTNLFYAGRIKRANKEIKRQQELLDQLEYTYGRLEKAAEKAFGADYVSNFKAQQKNLEAQARAYQAQAAAERSKGKKADKDKIKEYEEAYRATMDEIADMQGQVAAQLLGTDLTSAARDFARAWLDAYKEFGSTADAMSEKFREMIENMVVESLLARAMERALAPTFKMIDDMEEGDFYDPGFWERVLSSADKGARDADAAGDVIMKWAEQWGYNGRDADAEFTGIKRDIATASEESITGLSGHMATVEFYVSRVPRIEEHTAAIRALLEGGVALPSAGGGAAVVQGVDYTPLWERNYQMQQSTNRYVAEVLAECRRLSEQGARLAGDVGEIRLGLSRVMEFRGNAYRLRTISGQVKV